MAERCIGTRLLGYHIRAASDRRFLSIRTSRRASLQRWRQAAEGWVEQGQTPCSASCSALAARIVIG